MSKVNHSHVWNIKNIKRITNSQRQQNLWTDLWNQDQGGRKNSGEKEILRHGTG